MILTTHATQRLFQRFGKFNDPDTKKVCRLLDDNKSYQLIRTEDETGIEVREIDFSGEKIHGVVDPAKRVVLTIIPANQVRSVMDNATESDNAARILMLERIIKSLREDINTIHQSKNIQSVDGRFYSIDQQLEALRWKQKKMNERLSEHENGLFIVKFIKGFFAKRRTA